MVRTKTVIAVLWIALAGCAGVDSVPGESPGVVVQSVEIAPELRDRVFTLEHFVPVSEGARLHVIEKYTAASVVRRPRRAVVMLTGTLVTNVQYDADVPGDRGYNALERAAREGYFAFSVTYEGYGQSSHPADGRLVTAERMLRQMGDVVEWVRERRGVNRVDLLGASIGSSLAVALGGVHSPIHRNHIGRLVLTAVVYKSVTPLFQSIFFSPETRAALETAPGGYIQTVPEMYGIILARAEPDAAAWAFEHFPGVYATGPTLEGFDLPVFDAQYGRAPALQFWGDQDPITPREDVEQFQREYGGPIRLVVLPGGGHTPNFEAVREVFWRQTFEFLNERGRGYGE